MGNQFENDLDADSLDLVERVMALEEEFGIEVWEEGPDDWSEGTPAPRPTPPPTLSGGAIALFTTEEAVDPAAGTDPVRGAY